MALTKVSGGILDPGIDVAGIVTATGFDGTFTGGSSKNITAGIVTATGLDVNGNGDISGSLTVGSGGLDLNGSGDISGDLVVHGNLTANGDFTTLNTTLREVEILRVDANSSAIAGIITQSGSGHALYVDGTTILGNNINVPTLSAGTQLVVSQLSGNSNFVDMTILGGRAGRSMIRFGDQDSNNRGSIQYHHTDESINFYNNGNTTTPRLTIHTGGEVGIGSITPTSKLDIYESSGDGVRIRAGDQSADVALSVGSAGTPDKFVIQAGGNVGIGSENPTQALDVKGKIKVFGSDGSAYGLVISPDSSGGTYETLIAKSNADLRLQAGSGTYQATAANILLKNTTKHIIINAGNDGSVGIGTDNPSARLETNKSGTTGYLFRAMANLTIGNRSYDLKPPSSNSTDEPFSWNTPNAHAFQVDGVEKLRINHLGKVGIGTDNPQTTLEVVGTGVSVYNAAKNAAVDIGNGRIELSRNDSVAYIDFKTGSSEDFDCRIQQFGNGLRFYTGGQGSTAERVRIDSDGNVGINSTAPNTKLDVIASYVNRTWTPATSNTVLIERSGINRVAIVAGNTSHSQIDFADTDDDNAGYIRYDHDDNSMSFRTNGGGERLRITSSGAVGINTTVNAATKLQVQTDATSTTAGGNIVARFQSNGSGRDATIQLSDNVANSATISMLSSALIIKQSGTETLRITAAGKAVFSKEIETPQDYPNFRPTLDLNFTAEKKLDPRITYQRTGSASFTDKFGKVVLVGDNVPRFNHDPTTKECKGLLIEQSRTNFVRNSLGLGSGWAAGNGSFAVDNSITNPDGSVGAYHHTGAELYHQNIDLSGASTNTVIVSLWIKERSGQSGVMDIQIYQQISGGAVVIGAFSFNPTNAVITTPGSNFSNGTVEEYPNGWYRVSAKVTTSSGNFTSSTRYDIQGAEHYVWGFQMEVGEFLTSFIPTNGVTATRGADLVKVDGEEFTEFYNPVESTVVCEFDSSNWLTYNNNVYERIWSINNGSESDLIEMFKENTVSDAIRFRVRDGNANVLGAFNISYGTNTTPKMAFAVKLNDAAAAVDGTISGTTDNVIPMPTVDRLNLGNDNDNNQNSLNGHIRRFTYYPVKLPDSQVVTLTS